MGPMSWAVSTFPLNVPAPDRIVNVPPGGIAVSWIEVPLHMTGSARVISGTGIGCEEMMSVSVPTQPLVSNCPVTVSKPVSVDVNR